MRFNHLLESKGRLGHFLRSLGSALGGVVLCGLLTIGPSAFAQSTVSGTVTDEAGYPVISAGVMVQGTTVGTVTDLDGKYTLSGVSSDAVLSFSALGYKSQDIAVGGRAVIDVVLSEDNEFLDESVVIGYGTQKKADITSAVASVKAEDFATGNFNSAGDLVKGKVAGLTITRPSGDPGSDTQISLRGIVTVSGNATPLILVDGVPGSLTTVPPENIASIDVLKDASAAAIYGTRGAAGVIIITTKTGKREQKATATYAGYVSLSGWSKRVEFMDGSDIRKGLTNFNDEGYDTDWLKAISRTALTHNHSFTINGGSSSTTYYGNISYRNAQGVMKKTGNEDLSMSFDVSHWMLNDMLKVNLNVVADSYKYDINDATSIYRQAVIRNPTSPIWDEDGSYSEGSLLQYWNPVSMQNEQDGVNKSLNLRMTGNVTFEPIKGWQTNLMLATDRTQTRATSYYSSDESINGINQKGSYSGSATISNEEYHSDYLEITSKYSKTFADDHRFEGLVGYSWSKSYYETSTMWNANFPTDYFQWNSMADGGRLKEGLASMSSSANDSKLIGFFARVSYGYKDRYNVLASIRYEGSSKFGDNHKWGAFPSLSLGWNIRNESFMSSTHDWLDELKLRAGYGVTGVIPYNSYQSMLRYTYSGGNYYRDGSWRKGLKAVSNPNPDLKWEVAGEFNIGLDWSILDGRVGGNIDYYYKRTSDMLYDYAVPSPPNLYTSTYANVGEMENKGIEILVKGVPVRIRNFEWNTTVTMQHNSNKLLSLSNDLYQTDNVLWQYGVGDPVSQITHKVEVGMPFGEIWGLKAVGVSEETGLFLIENPSTGLCAEFTQDMRDKRDEWYQRLGNGIPKVTIGWNNNLTYKNFDLSAQFTGQFGFKIINNQRVFYESNAHAYNRLKSAADKIGGIRALSSSQSQVVTSYYVENGDYLKLSNLTLGYTLDLNNKFLSQVRVYGSIYNVFTITGYKGIDPELGSDNFWTAGVDDRDKYPTVRSFTLGVNLTF